MTQIEAVLPLTEFIVSTKNSQSEPLSARVFDDLAQAQEFLRTLEELFKHRTPQISQFKKSH